MERKKLALISLGHLSCDVNGGAIPACLPYLRAAQNLDYQATAGFMLAYSCISSIIQPLLGFMADRHKKPWYIPIGIFLAGAGLAAMSFMSGYWPIFLCIAISGVGSAFFHPEGARFANKFSEGHKGAGMSFFSIGGNSGFILGPVLVAFFVGNFGLSGMFVFGLIALVMAVILAWQIREMPAVFASNPKTSTKPAPNQAEFAAADSAAAEGDELAAAKPLEPLVNNWRQFSILTVTIFARAIVFAGCNAFIPLFWVSGLGQSAAAGASALVVFGSVGVACNILGGFLTDKLGNRPVLRIAFCAMGPAALLFALNSNLLLAYAILPLLAFSIYLPFSAAILLGQKLLAKNIGFASGVTLGLSTTVGGILLPILGWAADTWSLPIVFMILAGVGVIGAISTFALGSPKRA